MKIWQTLFLLLLTLSVLAQQPGRDWQAEREQRDQAMVDSLGLDSLQTMMYKNLQSQFFLQMGALREKYPGQRDKIMEERQRYSDARDEQLKLIFSDAQWEKYQAILEEQSKNRSQRRGR